MADKPLVAFVGAHLPTYYAREYRVFERSVAGLQHLAKELDFELLAISEPVVTRAEAERIAGELVAAAVDFVLLQHGSFVMGDVLLPLAARRFRLGLWATEEPTKEGPIMLNNFVSMNLAAGILTHYLREQPLPFKWFYGGVDHPWFMPRLAVTVRALRALKRLAGARIGWVGGLAPTFLNLTFDERVLAARLGVEVQAHELGELITRARAAAGSDGHVLEELQEVVRALHAVAEGRVEVSPEDMATSAALYLAMREFADEHGYDALAVSDWPQFQVELGIHPGLAFSWLDERAGIPVASEGDVLGAVTMLMMAEATDGQAMLLDMNDLDFEREAVLMWHCGGSPLGFADQRGVRWLNHSTLGRKVEGSRPLGAVADLTFRPQPATIARIVDDGGGLLVLEAEVIESPHPGFEGSRGWLSGFTLDRQPLTLAELVNTVMVEGVPHHFILGGGHHGAALRELAAWSGMRLAERVPYRDHLQLAARVRW